MAVDKPEPTTEYIDAVVLWHDPTKLEWQWVARQAWPELARALDHTDPDVHAASLPTDVMLAALVERGTLRWQERMWLRPPERRLVTRWEVMP
jgi:hypothetical protein